MVNNQRERLLALADKWEAEIQVAYNDYAYGQRCAFEQAAEELRKLLESAELLA